MRTTLHERTKQVVYVDLWRQRIYDQKHRWTGSLVANGPRLVHWECENCDTVIVTETTERPSLDGCTMLK